ncbi:uncharacterized protein LOC126774867 isoform X2 [Nymphalis io]|uniref:uncharacterized protein LOC126774867 isoform X2 n=1 Tax=Inachis io TaxID=171585 RepID=UPI00216703A3|nr:uncharacterized protein LOC126774867 isoform X2 [Nymphalis io]
MSIFLSVCFLLSAAVIESAPKLGHVLFDPLSYEAKLTRRSKETYDSQDDWLEESLRMPAKTDKTTKKPCLGYDYDETLCKTVDDRVICGYNKNKGNISDVIADLGNGCRIRGGRLECGYLVGPFDNPRRPPARDTVNNGADNSLSLRYRLSRSSISTTTQFTSTVKKNKDTLNVTTSKETKNPKFITENITNSIILNTKILPVITSTVKTSLINNYTVKTAPLTNLSSISRRQYNATKLRRLLY